MKVEAFVSTMNQKDHSILEKMNIQTDAIVINQCDRFNYESFSFRDHMVRFYSFSERGVGLSRNSAMMRATGDIGLFADDDLIYVDGYENLLLKVFEEYPEADVIAFIVMYSGMILVIHITKSILLARGFSMVCSLISGMAIGLFAKKQFPSADFRADYSGVRIEGTKELFISKIVGMCYSSLTVFYLSVFTGTLYTSVYAVYNSAISLITHYVHSMSTAPQNALGQVINQEGNRLKKILAEFEYTTVLMSSILFSVTMVMLIPFVRIYTAKIVDVDYIQPLIGIFMVLTSVMQIIHIPSGLCIELSGRFRIVKRIQYIALVVLVILSSVGSYFYGFLGLLAAKLITNIVLAVIEVSYAHSKIVPHSIGLYIKITVPNLLLASLLTLCEYSIMCEINLSIWGFLITGFVITILNAVILLGFNRLLYKELLMGLTDRFKRILLKKIQKNA